MSTKTIIFRTLTEAPVHCWQWREPSAWVTVTAPEPHSTQWDLVTFGILFSGHFSQTRASSSIAIYSSGLHLKHCPKCAIWSFGHGRHLYSTDKYSLTPHWNKHHSRKRISWRYRRPSFLHRFTFYPCSGSTVKQKLAVKKVLFSTKGENVNL